MASILLEVNCGYARCAMRELTPKNRHQRKDNHAKAEEYHTLFEDCPEYGFPSHYFEAQHNGSLFERHCTKVISIWSKKWHPKEAREKYESTFSTDRWKAMITQEKQKHRLTNCIQCFKHHQEEQMSFPQGPYFDPEPVVTVNTSLLSSLGKKKGTTEALKHLDTAFHQLTGQTFVDALAKNSKVDLQKKPTKTERNKKHRELCRKIRDKENKAIKRTAAVAALTEDESMRSYQCKRMKLFFESSSSRERSHAPNLESVPWNKQEVLDDLKNIPETALPINWTQFAKDHNIPGKNSGQVAKEFAKQSGINVFDLDRRPEKTRTRSQKRKFPWGEISVPTHPPPSTVREEWANMIESNELSLGVPCMEHTVTRFVAKDGAVEKKEITVIGRKFPLLEVRKQLLEKHTKFMRMNTDDEFDHMNHDELLNLASRSGLTVNSQVITEDLRQQLTTLQRTRTLALWHDHATLGDDSYHCTHCV